MYDLDEINLIFYYEYGFGGCAQLTHDVRNNNIITVCQNDLATSFWHDDVIIGSHVCGE